MNRDTIFWAVLGQIGIVIALYLRLAMLKARAVREKRANLAEAALDNDAWPDEVRKVSNSVRNQFEAPVLFFAVVFATWALNAVDAVSLALAFSFVVLRIAHATIHVTTNYVPHRRGVFIAGIVVLVLMTANVARALIA